MKDSKLFKDEENRRNLDEAIKQVDNNEVIHIELTEGKVFEQMKKLRGHY
jgi:hypothetical protein